MVRTLLVCATGEPKENAPFDPLVTFGSLPDDALASIMDKLSAQEAARAEPTSKTFRRLRPRVVAAQRNHALRDAKVTLTVASDGQAYSMRSLPPFPPELCVEEGRTGPRLTCVGTVSDFTIKMNRYSPGWAHRQYLIEDGELGYIGFCKFTDDPERATHFERVDAITTNGQAYSTLPGASYIRSRGSGRYLVLRHLEALSSQWPICHVTEGDLTVHRHNWPGECHAFFFLDRLARTLPDFPDSRRVITRDLERRFGVEGWDLATLSEIVTTAQGDRGLALKSILATGSPEAWHTWRSTWPDHPFMPGSSMAL